jgi:HEAT repeat protein
MRRRLTHACLVALALTSTSRFTAAQSLPRAQTAAPVGHKALLIAGRDDREPLSQLASLLKAYGFEVQLLSGGDAAREAIARQLRQLAASAHAGDLLFVMFSLPVYTAGRTSFLVPADGNPEQAWTLLRSDELVSPFTKSDFRAGFMILPACQRPQRFAQMNAPKGNDPLGITPPGLALLTYCPAGNRVSAAQTLMEILRRGSVEGRIDPPQVAEGFNRAMPSAEVDLQIGFATSERLFTFDAVRDRLAADLAALARPTEETIARAVRNALASPPETRAADVERVGQALARVAENRSQAAATRTRAVRGLGDLNTRDALSVLGRVAGAQDDETALRVEAIEAIARIGTPTAVPIARARLRDPERSVREAAVRAVAALRDDGAITALNGIVRNDPEVTVKIAAVQALALLPAGRSEGRATLVAALRDPSPLVRRVAASAIGSLSLSDAAPDLLTAYRQERDPSVQQAVIYAVARIPHPPQQTDTIEAVLLGAGRSDAVEVREAAIFSLGSFSSPRALAMVRTALSDDNERVQGAAIQSTGRQRNAEAVPQLIPLLDDQRPGVRAAAVESLGRIGDRRAASPLVAKLNDQDEYVQKQAKRWLSALQANDELTQALQDPSAPVRLRAIETLAAGSAQVPVGALIQALGDEDYDVRVAATALLSRTADDNDVGSIVQAIGGNDARRQASALIVIGNLSGRFPPLNLATADSAIETALRSPLNSSVRAEALRTAGRLGRPEWLGPILSAVTAEDASVRRAAAEALGHYDTPDALAALQRLVQDSAPDVQQAAIDSLRRLNRK